MTRFLLQVAAALVLLFCSAANASELRGHGGPVRALSVTADGKTAITGSFDAKAIIWSIETGEARQVLQFHDGQINAVAALPSGRFVTAGADGRIAIWAQGQSKPVALLEGHTGPVVALAVSTDGAMLGSASWDRSVRLWPLSGGKPQVLNGHGANVNAVAFLSDGTLASAGYDTSLILWPTNATAAPVKILMPAALSTLAATPDDQLFVGGADGRVRELDRRGNILKDVPVSSKPLLALSASPNSRYLAAAAIDGTITLLDAVTLAKIRTLGPAVPAWSLAFASGGQTLLAGSADNIVREWDVESGQQRGTSTNGRVDPMAKYAENPDAKAFRACVACHTLHKDEEERAGPTLHKIFGRRIASVPGYRYSPAFLEMDIIWTPKTVSRLFEVGPSTYTPGTKMPEQRINDPGDRAALIRFLQAETNKD